MARCAAPPAPVRDDVATTFESFNAGSGKISARRSVRIFDAVPISQNMEKVAHANPKPLSLGVYLWTIDSCLGSRMFVRYRTENRKLICLVNLIAVGE